MIAELRANLPDRIGKYTSLRKVSAHEWAGACPRCGGRDRFRVNDQRGWFCRQCTQEPGSAGHWQDYGDFMAFVAGWTLKETLRSLGLDRRLSPAEIERLDCERREAQAKARAEEAAKQSQVHDQLNSRPDWKTYAEHMRRNPQFRDLWRKRGLSDRWQDYYAVGYNPGRTFGAEGEQFLSSSLTIPYFRLVEDTWRCIGLQHRLLIPNPPGGKFRPHLAGAGKHLFFSDVHDSAIWPTTNLLLVEGEVKAMITWANLWQEEELIGTDYQVVGIPGKGWKEEWIADFAQAKRVYICLDPDAQESAHRLCKAIGDKAKNILLPDKIDDLLNMGVLDTFKLLELLEKA